MVVDYGTHMTMSSEMGVGKEMEVAWHKVGSEIGNKASNTMAFGSWSMTLDSTIAIGSTLATGNTIGNW